MQSIMYYVITKASAFCSTAFKAADVVQVERNLASGAKNLFMPHTLVAEQVMPVVSSTL